MLRELAFGGYAAVLVVTTSASVAETQFATADEAKALLDDITAVASQS